MRKKDLINWRFNLKMDYASMIILFFIFLSSSVFSQDAQFTQFTNTPILLNPGQTGDINGEFRVGYLYRNQWNSISSPFTTSHFFTDKKFLEERLKGNFVGGGLSMVYDNTGGGALTTTQIGLNTSYHHYLDRSLSSKIYGGIQISFFQKSLNANLLAFENQFNYSNSDFSNTSNTDNIVSSNIVRPDFTLGAGYWKSEKKYYINAGLSAAHFTRPNLSFTGGKDLLATKWTLHADGQYNLSKFLFVTPALMIKFQNMATQFNFGAMLNYGFGKTFTDNIYVKTGMWFRVGDAVNFVVGLNHNNWQFNVSYDINASSLHTASHYNGAIELSILYTHNLFNIQKNKTRTIPCKRLF